MVKENKQLCLAFLDNCSSDAVRFGRKENYVLLW